MSDLISKKAVVKVIENLCTDCKMYGNDNITLIDAYEAINVITELPTSIEADRWIPVSSGRLPEIEKEVEITVERRWEGKTYTFTCRAIYEDGTMWNEDSGYSWHDLDMEYDEDHDDFKVPEGWFEAVSYAEEFAVIDDFVVAWKPLPEPWKESINV